MTLGEFIKQYRNQHDLSIRAFAEMTGISVQQVSNIEKGIGNNGKPMTSTMGTYKKIAEALGYDEQAFLLMLNDSVRVNPFDEREELKSFVDTITDQEVSALLKYIRTELHRT